MTLCIARATTHQIFLLADTRISNPLLSTRADVTSGSLKTVFLSPSVALAFTGDPQLAQAAVESFRSARGEDAIFGATIAHFKATTEDSENEYLLAFSGPKRLFRIHNGRVDEKSKLWIGDQDGFARFQKGARSTTRNNFSRMTTLPPGCEDKTLLFDQIARFQEVIEDPAIPNVGDFFTLAISNGGVFRFALMATLYFDSAPSKLLGSDGLPVLRASGENGLYRHGIWTPKNPMNSAITFTFASANVAFAFYSTARNFAHTCIRLPFQDEDTLQSDLETRLGFPFDYVELKHA